MQETSALLACRGKEENWISSPCRESSIVDPVLEAACSAVLFQETHLCMG